MSPACNQGTVVAKLFDNLVTVIDNVATLNLTQPRDPETMRKNKIQYNNITYALMKKQLIPTQVPHKKRNKVDC